MGKKLAQLQQLTKSAKLTTELLKGAGGKKLSKQILFSTTIRLLWGNAQGLSERYTYLTILQISFAPGFMDVFI